MFNPPFAFPKESVQIEHDTCSGSKSHKHRSCSSSWFCNDSSYLRCHTRRIGHSDCKGSPLCLTYPTLSGLTLRTQACIVFRLVQHGYGHDMSQPETPPVHNPWLHIYL